MTLLKRFTRKAKRQPDSHLFGSYITASYIPASFYHSFVMTTMGWDHPIIAEDKDDLPNARRCDYCDAPMPIRNRVCEYCGTEHRR